MATARAARQDFPAQGNRRLWARQTSGTGFDQGAG
jgi:hypothetical protein